MRLAKRDGTGPDASSKFLSSCPKGLVWRTFFFFFSPSGFPQISHLLHPVSFLFFGGVWVDMGWMSCMCVRTYLSVLCMCFPTTLHYALCSFGIFFCWGTLCNISIPTTSQGSCDLRPAPSQQCISLHPPPPPPPFFLSPSLPTLHFVGCSTALTRSTGNK